MARKVKPLQRRKKESNGEPLKRYYEARQLLQRLSDAFSRHAYEDGETIDDAMDAARNWLSHEDLEEEIFGDTVVPVSKRATGRTIPDLRGLEHVCEYQRGVRFEQE